MKKILYVCNDRRNIMANEKTLYDYCKEISSLYELESQLSTLRIKCDDNIKDKIIDRILDLEDEMRDLIKGDKI